MERQIVAKMACWQDPKVSENADGSKSESIALNAVYGEEGVNKEWARYTPAGSLQLVIDNPPAQGFFQRGKEYIVTIREAQPGE